MIKKENKRPELYRIVIIFFSLFLMCIEIYVFLISYRTVKVSSFDVEIAGYKVEINEGKKTFSVSNDSGSFAKTSKEYKEVLTVSWNDIAVIDTDEQLKVIDVNENVLAVFKSFSLNTKYVTSTTIFEEENIIRLNFLGNENGKDFNIDYYYNKDTQETYVIENS